MRRVHVALGLFCIFFFARVPAVGAAIVTGPYLQNSRPDGITVMWETDTPGDSYVDYGPTAAYGSTAGQAESVTLHEVSVNSLAAGSVYCYRVRTGGTQSAGFAFRTAPTKGSSGFTFFAYGDNRTYFYAHEEVCQAMRLECEGVRTLLFNSGDTVTNDAAVQADWQREFFRPLFDVAASMPFYIGRGNHEGSNPLFLPYVAPPQTSGSGTEYYYSFDYGNVHFVVLDVMQAYAAGSPQHDWLTSDLASASSDADIDWIVACFHNPPFSTGSHGSDLAVRTAFHGLFSGSGVSLVINGHDHQYERIRQQDGVVYVVSGGAGAGLYSQQTTEAWSAIYRPWHHFCAVDVTDTTLSVRAHAVGVDGWRDGELFDSIVIGKGGGWGPSAVVHPDLEASAGGMVVLDGSASFDPEGSPLIYTWTQLSGPGVALSGAATAQPSFVPAEAGEYVFRLVTSDGALASVPDTVRVVVTDAAVTSVTLNPVADAWVSSGAPGANYNTSPLNVDGEASVEISYLKFDVPAAPPGKQLLSAVLSLHCENDSDMGGYVRTASDSSWTASGITYDSRPLPDGLTAGSLGQVAVGSGHAVDVTDAVAGPGLLTLVLLPGSGDGADYSSVEDAANAPELVLKYVDVFVDAAPPAVAAASIVVTGTVSDNASTPASVLIDGTETPAPGGAWTSVAVPYAGGAKTVSILAVDASSNEREVRVSLSP
ncbi:MAG: metallophosphoesterase family protein [Planctomycetes bacterium]|nr:metallophosphoesterase family protein [Planctomycetota bacterium]